MSDRSLSNQELLLVNKRIFGYIPKFISTKEVVILSSLLRDKELSLYLNKFLGLEVLQDKGCWIKGDWSSYSHIKVGNKTIGIHRVAFRIFIGNIIKDNICHYCDRKGCRNPWHLFQGSQSGNIKDARLKGRVFNVGTRKQSLSLDIDALTMRSIMQLKPETQSNGGVVERLKARLRNDSF